MSDLGDWHCNTTIEGAEHDVADLERRHGGKYVIGPAHATATKTAEELAALGLRGIYREVENADAVDG